MKQFLHGIVRDVRFSWVGFTLVSVIFSPVVHNWHDRGFIDLKDIIGGWIVVFLLFLIGGILFQRRSDRIHQEAAESTKREVEQLMQKLRSRR